MERQKHFVKVNFANGNSFNTDINGTKRQVRSYFKIGRFFNVGNGSGGDSMQPVSSIEFLAA